MEVDAETPQQSAGEKHLIFTILGKYYTFPSRFIGEVTAFERVYPLPLLPDYIQGIINRYSTPYALLDLGLLIQKTATSLSKVVVLKESIDKVAFLIDDVVDIADVPPEKIMKMEQAGEDSTDIIESSFEWQGQDGQSTNVFVLDISRILGRIRSDFGQ